MYSLIERLGLQLALRQELVPFAIAFTIAELFYKFKSFTLECMAFLITWYALSFIQSWLLQNRS